MHSNIFAEVSILIALCTAVAMLMRFLRQPLIIGYILTGLIVGPSILGIVNNPETIDVLGNFGIALLLFIVGLGLNPKVIKEVGKVSFIAGVGQVALTTTAGFLIAKNFGYSKSTAVYISVALAFSSTIIILKLLGDKHEQNKLYGKILIGILLVQDVLATLAILFAATSKDEGLSVSALSNLAIKGSLLVIALFLVANFVVKPLTNFLSKSQELLFLFALAWGFGVATAFYQSGFSLEVGALLAGISLSTMTYTQGITAKLRPLRDFFIVVFFIALGSKLNISDVSSILPEALILSGLVLILKPLIILTLMGIMGYTKKTSFKASIASGQVSEFSLILILVGLNNGQLNNQVVSLVTIVATVTIAISTYFIMYSDGIYAKLEKALRLFERKKVKPERIRRARAEAVLFGYKRGGSEYTHVFKQISKKFLVVDYDPDSIDELDQNNIPYIYGDATDLDLLDEINFTQVKFVVSVISDYPTNVFLLNHLRIANPKIVAVCHADTVQQAIELYGLGASFVVLPHYIGNEKVGSFIKRNGFKKSEFNRYREKHLSYLQSHFEADDN